VKVYIFASLWLGKKNNENGLPEKAQTTLVFLQMSHLPDRPP